MAQDKTYYLTEGLWISAAAPTGAELRLLGGGGGGLGGGGWGLSEGYPRGTSPTKNDIARVISTRRVLTEEYQVIEKDHEEKYTQEINQLPETIAALKAQIRSDAQNTPNPSLKAIVEQQVLTSRISQMRENYLQILPDANSYFGVPAFYKRGDSMMSRFLDPGFIESTTGEALGAEWATKLQRSWDGAYRLHLLAQKHQSLADELKGLAGQVDQEELTQQPLDLLKVIARRTAQIHVERQIHFECLPNVIQHELGQTVIGDAYTLAQTFNAYLATASALVQSKQSQIPQYPDQNPRISSPLSKPQLEGLLHLVDEQRLRRAGQRWKEYHQALALSESIRFLDTFTSATQNLNQRAAEVEHLQAQFAAQQAAAEEAARLQAEAERLAAEEVVRQQAEAERLAAEEAARQQAETERLAAEAERQQLEKLLKRISYNHEGRLAASVPAIIPIGAATFAIAETAYTALGAAISAALTRIIAASTPALAVGSLAMAWPSTLANSERHYLISTPLANLSPPNGPDLVALALSSTSIDLPYLLAGAEDQHGLDLYVVPGAKPVPVRAATFDSERQLYSLALENPQRILTWTPASAPGDEQGSSTSLPPAPPGTVVYTGSSLNPVSTEQDGYPALELLDQERLIITFPLDSGLPPILVVFKSPRYEPGVVSGVGSDITEVWLGQSSREEGALIPTRIAAQLIGREFNNFNAFRMEFWRSVSHDAELSKQFSQQNLSRMRNGNAPITRKADAYGLQRSFILHHVSPIGEGGAVYDIDNLRVVTPIAHQKIHYGDKS